MSEWGLPQTLQIGGAEWVIHADYRDVLEVIEWLENMDETPESRLYIAMALFYADFEQMPFSMRQEAAEKMLWFIAGGTEETGPAGPKLLDWKQDRQIIAADINKVAGCEVRALHFAHWWTFLGWFGCVGEGQLATVVSIRDKLRRGKKLQDWERDYYMQNRTKVDLKRRYTAEEKAEQEKLKQMLGD